MTSKTIYLEDYKVSNYKVEDINLNFDLYDRETIVKSDMNLYKNTDSKEENILKLNWENLELIKISINDKELENTQYELNNHFLIIKDIPNEFNLKITNKIHPETNTSLEGLYISSWKFCTQCEPLGFRRITYYLDRPDVMTKFTTRITGDKTKLPVLLSNWNKIEEWDLENNRHFVKWYDPFAKPSYLFALVAWDLESKEDSYTTMSWREIDLKIFTESHNIPKCDFAMESLKKSMKWDEDRFWLEYDLDLFMIVAVDDFNAWAMENKWLNIFNSALVFATPKIATDKDYTYIERVVAHEYFHNWTWDRVTCRDWFQLSLKEWLTVFRDSEFTADMNSRSVKRIDDVKYLRNNQFREDASPLVHPIRPASFQEINNFYTVTVYEKWSEVIRMYQTLLWVDWFRKWMDLYFERHDWEAVTTEDFLSAMADANNTDLSQFQTWYDQAWTPIVEVTSNYNENNKTYTLNFKQSCLETPETKKKKPFIIPIKLWLIDIVTWKEILDNLIVLTDFEHNHTFKDISSEPIVSLLRNFSAPVKLKYNYSHSDYAFLIENDSDNFNKYEASQNFAKDLILNAIKTWKIEINKKFINAIKNVLDDNNLDNSFKAEVISLPTENEIGDLIWVWINPVKIHEIRESFIHELVALLKDSFKLIYNSLNTKPDYKINPKDIWDRKLKNICLMYLSYNSWVDIAYKQYKEADNMTDKLAALSCLSNIESEISNKALDDFYSTWKDDDIVLNKWFSLQAISSLDNTFDKIKALSKHKSFNLKNPNKIRALYNSFTSLNPYIFHKHNKESYAFMVDKIIEIDKINSMIASRLAKTIINWKCLKSKLWENLKSELIRISKVKNISTDLREVIEKSLA